VRPDELAILVMAGGLSRRFGAADKLLADFDGQPLGLQAATRLGGFDWAQRLAVAHPSLGPALSGQGFRVLEAPAGNGLGDNIALAARALDQVAGVVILLADMPFVTKDHVLAMMDAAPSADAIVCTATGARTSPPVLIGGAHFAALRALSGDEGAKRIIQTAGAELRLVSAPAEMTADIDTLEDLVRWQSRE